MWHPKRAECKEQCPSCPFKDGNDTEFGRVLARLKYAEFGDLTITKQDIQFARIRIKLDTSRLGDFSCHHSAYDGDMKLKDQREHRQCVGATAFHRSEINARHAETKKHR